ncbi:MAG: hypothetical protein JWM78_3701 [Verrucomicrobiaceae bacterium]|nr:hypothetical protein [Verrucomicrobiaceae bacterium]
MRYEVGVRSKWQSAKTFLAWIGIAAIVTVICWVFLVHAARQLLSSSTRMTAVDWIVVLGGESGERVIGAAELYRAGMAPKVFVSGDGDCLLNVRRLEMAGVPAANITHECDSNSTYENAVYTRQILTPFNPKKIILVTSWYHTKRALFVFRHVWPGIQFGAIGVAPGGTSYYWLPLHESGAITIEYVKSVWYAVRYSSIGEMVMGK